MPQHPKSPPIFPYPWSSDWGEDPYGLWLGLDYHGVHVVFRWIEPGNFMMGSPEKEKGRFSREDHHQVTLSEGFWLAETTVTQVLWEAVMEQNPSEFKGGNLPVENISWNDCQVFLKKMSDHHTELELRLPWESEWEYACRAGAETAFNFGDEVSYEEANYRGVWEYGDSDDWANQALRQTAVVKSYSCNAWGLYEMHGNVWEWCQDHWLERLGSEAVSDPKQQLGAKKGARRVVRGGSWNGSGRNVRSAYRSHYSPDFRYFNLGLRLSLGQPSGSSRGGSR